jgi:GNAT superfamily N-acetyltransferase
MARLRRATLRDVPLLVHHRRRMWEDIGRHTEAALDAADPVYRRWLAQRLRSGTAAGFVVEARGEPAASGVLWVQEAQPRPGWHGTAQGYLLSMYTEPSHRRRGHAAAIIEAALAWARAQGVDRVTLHAATRARRIYERAGFARTHEMRLILGAAPPRRRPPGRR